jgi:hypothetical protein
MDHMDRFGALFVGKAVLGQVSGLVGNGINYNLFCNPSDGGFAKAAVAICENDYF